MKEINQKKCLCSIRDKNEFISSKDFHEFRNSISHNGNFLEIQPSSHLYSGLGFEEKWFKCNVCEQIWRLVTPDPPFAGVWEIVDEKEDTIYRNK